MNKSAIVICSGGLDSTVLAWHYASLNYSLTLLGFDYGQRHRKELDNISKTATVLDCNYHILDLTSLSGLLHGSSLTSESITVPDGHYAEDTMKATIVPNRNAIMLSIATGMAVADKVNVLATGVHAGDHFIYPDCRPEFFYTFSAAMRLANEGDVNELLLEAPFISWTKSDIVKYGNKLGVDFTQTWSCYKGGDKHCGKCGTCVERIEAFQISGVHDPTQYYDTSFALNTLAALHV